MNTKSTKRKTKADPLVPRKLDWSKAVRGKYFERYNEGRTIAVIDPDLVEAYPDSNAVNEALRALQELKTRLDALASNGQKHAA